MNCQDAREVYSRSEIGLTEKALVHAHVLQCTDCQKERASLPLLVNARHRVASSRPARLPRLRRLLTMSSTLSEQAAVRMLGGARTGATRAVDLLGRVRGLGPVFVKLAERTTVGAIGATRFAMATAVGLLTGLHALLSGSASLAGRVVATGARVGVTWVVDVLTGMRGLVSVCVNVSERAAAGAIAATRFAMATSVGLLIHLRRLLAIARVGATQIVYRSVVGSIGVARSGITHTGRLLTRLRAPVAISVTASAQAAGRAAEVARVAAPVIGRAGFSMTRVALLALQAAARVATEVGRAAVAGGRNSLISLRTWLSTSVTASRRVTGRLIAAMWTAGRVVVAPPAHVRPILKACVGIAGFAILAAALLASWPRPWRPDPVMAQREVRRSVERTPIEPATAPSLVQTLSEPEPAPAVVSPPDTPRVATRPRPSETRTEIPAPARRSTASASSSSTAAVEGADAADSTAAIDWLLKGGGGRRRIENP